MKVSVKKPMNAYFFYKSHMKDTILINNPNANSSEIAKIAALQWKNEPEHIKEIYREQSRKAFRQHKLDHPNYEWKIGKRGAKQASTSDSDSESICKIVRPRVISLKCNYTDFDTFVESFINEFKIHSHGEYLVLSPVIMTNTFNSTCDGVDFFGSGLFSNAILC
ncbi:hypothetical protein HDV06_005722 [Boothiomyces sp. JEL0866]|nr:hypothetical protein HDV06_005722 [Boothiomyces sp. JEL0866]